MTHGSELNFAITGHTAWAPGIETPEAWAAWARAPYVIEGDGEAGVRQMPAMLRRRAGTLGKMALEVAYQSIEASAGIPVIFCSRHGEVGRSLGLLRDLVQNQPLSPMSFGLAVHNAIAGLFSIARADQANHPALAASASTIEHAVIEACGLLADGAEQVLLVAYDQPLPEVFAQFEDSHEQPYAWAWMLESAGADMMRLSWRATGEAVMADRKAVPAGLDILRFYLSGEQSLERVADHRCWRWERHA
ncbi:3-oxoacyl-ACP synthase [Herminiimonas sp. KBW02]|uniref:beta-ketoacyl synthase chain length factor n=1 Tax=Herminiimonas sp. KBW02 TaxID=2153363 RepID=UPI000F599B15|nr:beta-ketoacyl synthase chain length factor [Herminiimonas sp. KBW02]RQO37126.1 3-oxoacyl-ACP synthase [Herminiimonas sp. KBW02]